MSHMIVSRDLVLPETAGPLTMDRATQGPRIAPSKVIQTYDADDWEVFIEEWATSLTPEYIRVQRFGGSGDRGVDVAGFREPQGFEGNWDCFQGKHYEKSLTPTNAWPELLKIFLLPVRNAAYKLPANYYFIAPLGVATGLGHLLSTPSDLKAGFLKQLNNPTSQPFRLLSDQERSAVSTLATNTDFSMFGTITVLQLLKQHSRTPHHTERFGGSLPMRPPFTSAPAEAQPAEVVYLEKLLTAYQERFETIGDIETAEAHDFAGGHMKRQREYFYRAEALRRFARDSVPPKTFEGLQDEVHDAVIETVEAPHSDGLERLRADSRSRHERTTYVQCAHPRHGHSRPKRYLPSAR